MSADDTIKLKWTVIIGACACIVFTPMGYLWSSNQRLEEVKATKEELKDCKVSLAVNLESTETRIMKRLDKIDDAVSKMNQRDIDRLEAELRRNRP